MPSLLLSEEKLGVIGGGVMAKSIIFPLLELGILDPGSVIVAGPRIENLNEWKSKGCSITTHNYEVTTQCALVLWAVKPQKFKDALKTAFTESSNCPLHISVLAGVKLRTLFDVIYAESRNKEPRIVRVMPNIALRVKAGAAANKHTTVQDKARIEKMFSTGICSEVPEEQINAFCGLFGSGLGFMFPILEAMSDGALKAGIPRPISIQMAAQAMKGAAELILQEKSHPAIMKDSVCSPAGTTIAGICEMEKVGVRNAMINAIFAATKRGEELGQMFESSVINSNTRK